MTSAQVSKEDIIRRLDDLSPDQLRQVAAFLDALIPEPASESPQGFLDYLQQLRAKYQVTDEEFAEFDRILEESRQKYRPMPTNSTNE